MTARRRITDPVEAMAQRVAERVVELVLQVVDLNAVLAQVDVNALLARVDVAALLERVDLNAVLAQIDIGAILDRVDMNDLLRRIDMDALVEQTDLGAVIARSSGGVASEALDAGRSQAVGLDQFIDRWVQRALRRNHAAPSAPGALPDGEARAVSDPPSTTGGAAPQPPGEGQLPTPQSGAPPARPSEAPAREATE
ncbi:MAG TPA: hypothetical protein VNO54_26590 [Streptosporangiaceae bacterium]|nr:hypothetical protein [Streptosporangiaceae bacterium]